jgi:monofunctional biosynthetic peptidoglycan transglycosylase
VKTRNLFPALLVLAACGSGQGCVPKFTDLKKKYPHVIYHGRKLPSEVVLKENPPPFWAPISSIPKKVQGAILVSEDWAFFQHGGYDEKQIQEAIKESIEAGKLTRGASTITQQVVRNLYLSKEKSIGRKVHELWLSTKIEKVIGKQKILEIYFNIAEMGDGIFGIGQASRRYFQKSPSELRPKEAAFLAMLLPSPKRYSVSFTRKELSGYARRTIRSILNKMVMAHYLTPEERDAEWATPLAFETKIDVSIPPESGPDEEGSEEEGSEGESSKPALEPSPSPNQSLQSS